MGAEFSYVEMDRDLGRVRIDNLGRYLGDIQVRYFKQTDFPQNNLQQAQNIAAAIVDNFDGKQATPPDVARALGISPTSSAWNPLTGSSLAYGLTEGASSADVIKLSPLGRKLVAPEDEGADVLARREAILKAAHLASSSRMVSAGRSSRRLKNC